MASSTDPSMALTSPSHHPKRSTDELGKFPKLNLNTLYQPKFAKNCEQVRTADVQSLRDIEGLWRDDGLSPEQWLTDKLAKFTGLQTGWACNSYSGNILLHFGELRLPLLMLTLIFQICTITK